MLSQIIEFAIEPPSSAIAYSVELLSFFFQLLFNLYLSTIVLLILLSVSVYFGGFIDIRMMTRIFTQGQISRKFLLLAMVTFIVGILVAAEQGFLYLTLLEITLVMIMVDVLAMTWKGDRMFFRNIKVFKIISLGAVLLLALGGVAPIFVIALDARSVKLRALIIYITYECMLLVTSIYIYTVSRGGVHPFFEKRYWLKPIPIATVVTLALGGMNNIMTLLRET